MNKSYDVYMCRKPSITYRFDTKAQIVRPPFPPVIHYNPQSIAHYARARTDKQIIRKTSWIQRIFGW